MEVRTPSFDLTDLRAHWAPNREWVHQINANGIVPTAIEPFLIKVMRRAKAELDASGDADLIRDIETFNKQEAQHYRIHDQFNEAVANDGYPGLLEHDRALKAEYAGFLATKDLVWLVGFCEAFESMAAAGAAQWVDGGWGEYLDGADPRVVALWRWHLAEEYEHRTVVHRLFLRICPGSPDAVHGTRIELLNFFLGHLATRVGDARSYLLEVDRSAMSPEQRGESEEREKVVAERFAAGQAGIAAVMEPTWDPASLPPPRHLADALAPIR